MEEVTEPATAVLRPMRPPMLIVSLASPQSPLDTPPPKKAPPIAAPQKLELVIMTLVCGAGSRNHHIAPPATPPSVDPMASARAKPRKPH